MTNQNRQSVILDDGEYFVVLAMHQVADGTVGFLERRCAVSGDAPNGHECVGTFTRAANGGWAARLASEFDPATGREYHLVADGVMRLEAIVSLWRSRQLARIAGRSRPTNR